MPELSRRPLKGTRRIPKMVLIFFGPFRRLPHVSASHRCPGACGKRWPQRSKSPRNVGAVLGVKRSGAVFDMDLGTPAVEFDLVNPVRTGRRYFRQGGRHRLNEGNFTQHAADVGRRVRLYNAAIPSARRNPAAIPANRGNRWLGSRWADLRLAKSRSRSSMIC